MEEKAALYQQLAEVDQEIQCPGSSWRSVKAILYNSPQMERDIQAAEGRLEKPNKNVSITRGHLGQPMMGRPGPCDEHEKGGLVCAAVSQRGHGGSGAGHLPFQ